MRKLRDAGLICLARTEQRRGALEHFYVLSEDVQAPEPRPADSEVETSAHPTRRAPPA